MSSASKHRQTWRGLTDSSVFSCSTILLQLWMTPGRAFWIRWGRESDCGCRCVRACGSAGFDISGRTQWIRCSNYPVMSIQASSLRVVASFRARMYQTKGTEMKVHSRPCVHRAIACRTTFPSPSFRQAKASIPFVCRASTEKQATESGTGQPRKLEDGRMTYNPSTFDEMIADASAAVCRGLETGMTRMEVEFPVVSGTDCAVLSA